VESLEHYVARIGFAHNGSPPRVIALARHVARQMPFHTNARSYNYSTVCGYGPFSSAVIAALERLTGETELRSATLGRLRKVLTERLSGCFHGTRQWCPECYQRDVADRYEPLAWQMGTVTHCPLDGTRLECSCPNCGLPQSDFLPLEKRHCCQTCHAELGHGPVSTRPASDWEAWSNAASFDLLEFTSQGKPPLRGNPWGDFLKSMFESGHLPADRSLDNFRTFTWKAQRVKPRLQTVFQYAALNSVTPLQVLLDPRGAGSPTLALAETLIATPPKSHESFGSNLHRLQRAASVLVKNSDSWVLPVPGWLAKAFGCGRSSWTAVDPRGYAAYCNAYSGPRIPREKDRKVFDTAVRLVESNLDRGGDLTVDAIRVDLQARIPNAGAATICQNLSMALVTVGLVRQLSPGRQVTLKRTREHSGKYGRENI
jgi:hypothetical protein